MRRLLADGIATRRGIMAIHLEGAYGETGRGPPAHRGGGAAMSSCCRFSPACSDEAQDYVIARLAHTRLRAAG